jgi:predicted Zn-dependent protease with MMP-like domain
MEGEFDKLVEQAVQELPEKIRQKIENVAIIVEERPSSEQLRKVGVRYGGILLGLYEGIPQTKWGRGFGGNLPDKITIFKESVERFAKTSEEIKELVKNVVWHEVAHHFGFNEKEIRELERKRKLK